MDAFVPVGTDTPTIVQVKQAATFQATFDNPPAAGNKVFCLVNRQDNPGADHPMDIGGLTTIGPTMRARSDIGGTARLAYRDVLPGDAAGPYGTGNEGGNYQTTIFEVSGLPAGGPLNTVGATDQSGTSVTQSITPTGGVPAFLVGGFASRLDAQFGGSPTFTPNGSSTVVGNLVHNVSMHDLGQPFYGLSSGGAVTLGGTQGGTSSGAYSYGIRVAAFALGSGGLSFEAAPETVDEDDGSSVLVLEADIGSASDVFWRADLGAEVTVADIRAVLGMEDAGDTTILVQGGDASDWSDAATVIELGFDASGSLDPDIVDIEFDATETHRYWQFVLTGSPQSVEVFEVNLEAAAVIIPTAPSKAILEIYVHDEDASRWGIATWATGPATGTEGIWSAAGWQDVTPQGVNAHILWGSRAPERGILAEQNAASWNVETYDPDRILDPGNQDSPYFPQLVAGVPIRISHDSLVIRTGYIDRIAYRYKDPNFRGQLLCTDTWSLLNQAMVPADSILGNTLLERISDAINAAGIAVGGIPIPPSGPTGPTIADWEEGAALDDPTSVKRHIDNATQEALWVAYVQADAGLGLRPWGEPLDRGREITAENLEDLESSSSEEGLYSVARVQVEDPDLDPIEREAAPLPRYGRRMVERTQPTVDPEGWAAAVLQDRSWPGVGYVPGTIHCFTAADVDYFGSLEIMERVTIVVPGVVSVQGRILGGELFVEHRAHEDSGATWQFLFAIATDGSTAIGLTTLVADETGDTLVDDMTETDYLEAD